MVLQINVIGVNIYKLNFGKNWGEGGVVGGQEESYFPWPGKKSKNKIRCNFGLKLRFCSSFLINRNLIKKKLKNKKKKNFVKNWSEVQKKSFLFKNFLKYKDFC